MSEWQLVLETSGRVGKVGLARGGEVVHSSRLDESRRHARDLSATIRGVLDRESLRVADLKAILTSIGPGGYTGLRVGLATAKSLAYAADVPFVAVPTFHAVAAQAPRDATELWVIADALQGMVYVQRFTRRDGILSATTDLTIERMDEWLPRMSDEEWVSGPGVDAHVATLTGRRGLVAADDREPRVDGVLRAAERLQPLGRDELFSIEPLYLRGSSAEEKAKAAGR